MSRETVHGRTPRDLTSHDLTRANIPERYWPPRVTFSQVPEGAPYHDKMQKYLTDLPLLFDEGVGLYLWSERNGTGKTALGTMVLRRALQLGYSAYFTGAEELKDGVVTNQFVSETTTLREHVRNVDVLLIDDLGKEYKGQSGYAENLVEGVIRDRVRWNRVTCISTNLKPDQVKSTYSIDLADVLKESFYTLHIVGEDAGGRQWRELGRKKVKELMGDT